MKKVEIIAHYIQGYDKTVIFEYTYEDTDCTKVELVGWYFGKVDEDMIKQYSNRDYVCEM